MSTQRTEEQKLNPKPCKVGHCDNMCYCTEDKTTTDESVVDWEKEFDKHFKPTDSHMDGLFWYSSEQEATKEVKDFIRSLLLKTRTAEQERVVGILQNMRGVYSARDVIEKATEAIRGNEGKV